MIRHAVLGGSWHHAFVRLVALSSWLTVACVSTVACGGRAADATPTTGPVCNGIDLFVTQCSGGVCHHSGSKPARGLDLTSPDPAARLVGVSASCAGRLLVDPGDPSRSFLLEKISSDTPECGGSRMPLSGVRLSADVVTCVRDWVDAVARRW